MNHDRILAIAAHPDDLDFRLAGSAALWAREGRHVEYLICTSGEKGFNGDGASSRSIEERRAIRESEQRAAARVVGVKEVHFLRHPDGELANTLGLRRSLVRIMRQVKPSLVISDDPAKDTYDSFYGYHSDHRAIGQAVFDALYPAVGNENFFPELMEEGLGPHKPKEAYFGSRDRPDTWIDISKTFDLKVKALACHKSQIPDIEKLIPELRDWGRRNGEAKGLECAESFRSLEVPQ
ncbi:MAG: PIG-L deacetylase family protein [Nitrospinota bacterium]